MDYETIQMIENFIKRLDNQKKQIIARNLVVDPDYQISSLYIFDSMDLYIQNKTTGEIYNFSNFINSRCNCT